MPARFTAATVPDVTIIDPEVHRDERGFLFEVYHARSYAEGGITEAFVQDNHSCSLRGTLRGLHAQRLHPQGKLVRCIRGQVFDVAVDVRVGSPTFGHWVGAELSADNFRQIWIPTGFVHGFQVLSDVAEVEYKCTALYHPGDELAVAWNDPEIGIEWPLPDPVLSTKDAGARLLSEVRDHLPRYAGTGA